MNKQTNKKYLFAIDLDGTTLADSRTWRIHDETKSAIKRAKDEGHIVCILTGRPWRSTESIYHELGLDTLVANYNGAHIHNPDDPEFLPEIKNLNLNEVLYVLGDEYLKSNSENIAIEGPGWVQIDHRDDALEEVFGFKHAKKLREGLNLEKIPMKPTGLIIDTKEGTDDVVLLRYLERRFGDLGSFSYWSKGKNLPSVFDMTAIGARKDFALILMSRYYSIDPDNIIAFGDGFNDIPMFKVAGISVAMQNSTNRVKKLATHVTDKNNEEGGVGVMINKILDNMDLVEKEAITSINKMITQEIDLPTETE